MFENDGNIYYQPSGFSTRNGGYQADYSCQNSSYDGGAYSSYSVSTTSDDYFVASVRTTGTGSFAQIHTEIADGISSAGMYGGGPRMAAPGRGGRPNYGAMGELDARVPLPVGDVLLPMMMMVGVYAVVRFFKNRRKKVLRAGA